MLVFSDINYFHCLRIIDLLKETESSSKNIFGMYSSKRMKDWIEISRLYGKEDIYLGKSIQMLIALLIYGYYFTKHQI